MNTYPEIKKIAELNEEIEKLIEKLSTQLDVDGLDFFAAHFVKDCVEKNNHLYDSEGNQLDNDCDGPVDDDYYCLQYTGYFADDYYGRLYFKTDVPGTFIEVPFQM